MKKILLSLILIVATGNIAIAQDLNQLISDLSKVEGVQHQLVDKSMLDEQMKQAMEADPTGELASQMPGFMKKIDTVEAVVFENSTADVKEKVTTSLADFKDGDGYETLLKVKQQDADVRIIAKKGEQKSDIFIFVLAGDATIVMVKMTGDLDEQDFVEIVKEQQKNAE